jgi:DNA-binding transcriptional MerR regulator
MSIKQIKHFVTLSLEGDGTLKQRCALLQEHKKEVENQIQEMQKYLHKVTHKIEYFTEQYEKVTLTGVSSEPAATVQGTG